MGSCLPDRKESFNQKLHSWPVGWLCGMFACCSSTFFQGNRWRNENDINDWIVVLLTMGFLALMFSISFSKSYTQVEGKYSKQKQSIWDVVYRMPFSIDAYYRIVEKAFRKVM